MTDKNKVFKKFTIDSFRPTESLYWYISDFDVTIWIEEYPKKEFLFELFNGKPESSDPSSLVFQTHLKSNCVTDACFEAYNLLRNNLISK